jgi:hydroxyacylglutathione hydrolase
LVADTPQQYAEARLRLARVGIEDPRGVLQGGFAAWRQAGLPTARLTQITVQELSGRRHNDRLQLLDVRREGEWQAGHIEGAQWFPLDNFKVSAPELDPSVPVAVHCQSGYRSMIACSLLQRAGIENVMNVTGGFDAWRQVALPVNVTQPEVQAR